MVRAMPAAASASRTYSIIGRPSTGISTLGSSDFIRVPSPAANTTATASSMIFDSLLIGHGGEQCSGRFGAIVGGHDGGADGDAREAGGENFVQVAGFDAADGECGQRDFRGGLLEEANTGEAFELLGAGGEHGSAADVVGA